METTRWFRATHRVVQVPAKRAWCQGAEGRLRATPVWVYGVRVLTTEETGCPRQCTVLQQKRIRQGCGFSIKLGETNPTPSTRRESSKPRPPGGALEKFPLGREGGQGAPSPAGSFPGLFQRIAEAKRPAGSKRPELGLAAGTGRESPELRRARDVHTKLPQGLPRVHFARPESLKGHLPTKDHPRAWVAQGRPSGHPGPRPGALPRACQPRLTWPRRIRQPLDSSREAPLENFPNFFAALHALASGRPDESQKEETATAHAPGPCIHHRCPGPPFPGCGPHSPRAPRGAGAGKGSAVEVPKRCDLAASVPGPLWDAGFTWERLAFTGGTLRLRHQSPRAERRRVSLSGEEAGAARTRRTAGAARSPRASGSGHRSRSRRLG